MLEAADAEAEGVVDGAHPLRVALGQVVVDGDEVGAVAFEGVQVERQGGDQRLALAGLHLGDLALVEDDAADELDVEVAHADAAARGLADDGEGLGQNVVHAFAVGEALAELVGLGAELGVGQRLNVRLQLVDLLDERAQLSDRRFAATAEYVLEHVGPGSSGVRLEEGAD